MKRKALKVKGIKRSSQFANALLISKHPMDFVPVDLGKRSTAIARSEKGFGRTRKKITIQKTARHELID